MVTVNYYLSVMEDAKREIPPAAVAFCDAAIKVDAPFCAGYVTLKVPTTLWTKLSFEALRLQASTANMLAKCEEADELNPERRRCSGCGKKEVACMCDERP